MAFLKEELLKRCSYCELLVAANAVCLLKVKCCLFVYIHCTRRYSPLRWLTVSSCGVLQPLFEGFFALRAKKTFYVFFLLLILVHFYCSVVTSVTFSNNLSKFENDQKLKKKSVKNQKKNQKNSKIFKTKSKKVSKIKKIQENLKKIQTNKKKK